MVNSTQVAEFGQQMQPLLLQQLEKRDDIPWLGKIVLAKVCVDPKFFKTYMAIDTSCKLIVGGIYNYYFDKLKDCTELTDDEYNSLIKKTRAVAIQAVKEFEKCHRLVGDECIRQSVGSFGWMAQLCIDYYLKTNFKLDMDKIKDNDQVNDRYGYFVLQSLMLQVQEAVVIETINQVMEVDKHWAYAKNWAIWDSINAVILEQFPPETFIKIHHIALQEIHEIFSKHSYFGPRIDDLIKQHRILNYNVNRVRDYSSSKAK